MHVWRLGLVGFVIAFLSLVSFSFPRRSRGGGVAGWLEAGGLVGGWLVGGWWVVGGWLVVGWWLVGWVGFAFSLFFWGRLISLGVFAFFCLGLSWRGGCFVISLALLTW